jgi:hypothetical protein
VHRTWPVLRLLAYLTLIVGLPAALDAQQPVPGVPADSVVTTPGDTIPVDPPADDQAVPIQPPATPGAPADVPADTIPGDPTLPVPDPSPDADLDPDGVVDDEIDGFRLPELSASADSVLQLLRMLPGYTVTEYQGERATYTTDTGVLRLHGRGASLSCRATG